MDTRLTVVAAPGKSPGEVALHWPERRLIVVGDACVGNPPGELSLLPVVREAGADVRVVADGTSCRAQIADGAGRTAVHAAVVLAEALEG